MTRRYFVVAVRYRNGEQLSPWEVHNGFYKYVEAEEEREDWLASGQRERGERAKVVTVSSDTQAAIDAAIAKLNA